MIDKYAHAFARELITRGVVVPPEVVEAVNAAVDAVAVKTRKSLERLV